MTTPPEIREANRRLKAFLRTDAAYRAYVPMSTWLTGGCWLLAEALQAVLGGTLVAIYSPAGVEHVALQANDWLIDGDGFSRPTTLLRRWRDQEGVESPRLLPFNSVDAEARGIPPPGYQRVQLVKDLKRVLGGAT